MNIQNGGSIKAILIYSNLDNLLAFHPTLIRFASKDTVYQDRVSEIYSSTTLLFPLSIVINGTVLFHENSRQHLNVIDVTSDGLHISVKMLIGETCIEEKKMIENIR